MVIKFVESTYDSFKDKLKNPFYGTLFVVWIIRNREFIYNVFFHEKLTSDERLEIIRNQFLSWDSFFSFLGTIVISLGLMILIYASLNLLRFIVEFSERKLKPLIQRLFSKTSIVSREDYLAMEKDRDYFQKKYSEEREERIKLQRELDAIKDREDNDSKELELVDSKSNSTEYHGGIETQGGDPIQPVYNPQSDSARVKRIYDEMQQNDYLSTFSKMLAMINDMDTMQQIREKINSEAMDFFLSRDLAQAYPMEGSWFYKLTKLGTGVKEYHLEYS